MNKLITNRRLTIINFIIVIYFLLFYLVNLNNVDIFIVGFFAELLTIPFLLALVVFLFFGINYLICQKRNTWTTISVTALIICAILIIGSFFNEY